MSGYRDYPEVRTVCWLCCLFGNGLGSVVLDGRRFGGQGGTGLGGHGSDRDGGMSGDENRSWFWTNMGGFISQGYLYCQRGMSASSANTFWFRVLNGLNDSVHASRRNIDNSTYRLQCVAQPEALYLAHRRGVDNIDSHLVRRLS
jgi:hypothetical protein